MTFSEHGDLLREMNIVFFCNASCRIPGKAFDDELGGVQFWDLMRSTGDEWYGGAGEIVKRVGELKVFLLE